MYGPSPGTKINGRYTEVAVVERCSPVFEKFSSDVPGNRAGFTACWHLEDHNTPTTLFRMILQEVASVCPSIICISQEKTRQNSIILIDVLFRPQSASNSLVALTEYQTSEVTMNLFFFVSSIILCHTQEYFFKIFLLSSQSEWVASFWILSQEISFQCLSDVTYLDASQRHDRITLK